uniref:Uncharacterized protein n=1 Tax=Arundo donax TaxID=35708 RepID=A0A0A9DNH8_ARUDO
MGKCCPKDQMQPNTYGPKEHSNNILKQSARVPKDHELFQVSKQQRN